MENTGKYGEERQHADQVTLQRRTDAYFESHTVSRSSLMGLSKTRALRGKENKKMCNITEV